MSTTEELKRLAIKLKARQILEKQEQERKKAIWEPPKDFSMR